MAKESTILSIALKVALVASLVCYAIYCYRWIPHVTHGFAAYYTYARALAGGIDFRQVYDYSKFNDLVHSFGMPNLVDMPNNLPTNALALLPFCWLPPVTAKIIWSVVSLGFFGASIGILFHIYGISLRSDIGIGIAALIFLWRPIYDNIALGQLYFLLLFFFSLCMFGVRTQRKLLTALPVGLSMTLKGYGVVPLAWFAVTKRWRELFYALLAIIIIVIGTLPFFGAETWRIYYHHVVSTLGNLPTDAHTSFQTVNGLVHHLFSYDPAWLPNPLLQLSPAVVTLISYLLNLAVIAVVLEHSMFDGKSEWVMLSFAAVVAAGVVTAPLAEEYHFVLFLPLVIGLLNKLLKRIYLGERMAMIDWLFILALIIMAKPIGYKSLNYASFPLILLAYPKLYAGLAILGYFVLEQRKAVTFHPKYA